MEHRKLISFGKSSFVVSLPKQWLEKRGIEKGDSLNMEVDNKKITIYPEEINEEEKQIQKIVNIDGMNEDVIRRKINAAYVRGADVIRVEGDELSQKVKDIKDKIQYLVAMEVVEQTTERLVAKSFLDMENVEVHSAMRKADHIVRTMFSDLYEATDSTMLEATEISDSITERDNDLNKMCFLTFRALHYEQDHGLSKGVLEAEDMLGRWGFNFFLEEIGDEIKRIARLVAKCENREVLDDYKEVIRKITENYKDTLKGFYTDDKRLIYEVANRRNDLIEECDELLEENLTWLMATLMDKTKDLVDKIQNLNRISIMSGIANN